MACGEGSEATVHTYKSTLRKAQVLGSGGLPRGLQGVQGALSAVGPSGPGCAPPQAVPCACGWRMCAAHF